MDRYICIHGHFYQPPRENPWLEFVELQDSAYPFHDWNERITAECYEPNAASRILDGEGRIALIVNNYARISFNVGPTLLSWMEAQSPEVYRCILQADKDSQERFSGHGSAMAQAYNHMILPLANNQDKRTQVRWGIRDFEHRFGRKPEGMWLPETAVDLETLDILAQQGIKFTILSPYQAARVKKVGARNWRDVTGGRIDPKRPYLVRLSEGRTIAVFFYDGPISRAVAFEQLLNSGEALAHRLASGFNEQRDGRQLMHIATDGESYGHHHRHGDMALAYALKYIEEQKLAKLTNYGEFLEQSSPRHEVQIIENTAWSCAHGVERWNSHCGCSTGGRAGWQQHWRGPLREAMNWLRDQCIPLYEQKAAELFHDPWQARDEYIDVVLDRSPENLERFFAQYAKRPLNPEERVTALKLLELERHAMLMFTSCGWFFDEISGVESVQIIQYAGRVIQLAHDLSEQEEEWTIESEFMGRLAQAKSNVAEHQNGAEIYRQWVKPKIIGLPQVAAHYAISSVFETGVPIYCYSVKLEDYKTLISGKAHMALGHGEVRSRITEESDHISFAVLHLGDHNLSAGVRKYGGPEAFQQLVQDASHAFSRADIPQLIRLLDHDFAGVSYSLKSLFRDEQRRILNSILKNTLAEVDAGLRSIYDHHAPLIRFLNDVSVPPPKALAAAAEFVLNSALRQAFKAEYLDLQRIYALLDQAQAERIALDGAGLAYALEKNLTRLMENFSKKPYNTGLLKKLDATLDLVSRISFPVNLWRVQNLYYDLAHSELPQADKYDPTWIDHFLSLGRKLWINVEQFQVPQELATAS